MDMERTREKKNTQKNFVQKSKRENTTWKA
jgi:hypothetical protein